MKAFKFLTFFLLATNSAIAAPVYVYNCDANIVTKTSDENTITERRKSDITLTMDGSTVAFAQNTSNYKSVFHLKKGKDGSWIGGDSENSYLIRHQNGYYSLSFSIPQMKNTTILADSCKKVN